MSLEVALLSCAIVFLVLVACVLFWWYVLYPMLRWNPSINTSSWNSPGEYHAERNNYCGPGTSWRRLRDGDPEYHELDACCRQHDAAYNQAGKDDRERERADASLRQCVGRAQPMTRLDHRHARNMQGIFQGSDGLRQLNLRQ